MYKQFTKETWIELGVLKRAGLSNKKCSKQIGIDKSNIGREIKRYINADNIYRGLHAHKKYLKNRKKSKKKACKIQNDLKLKRRIKFRLTKGDSPEQIAGRINQKNILQKIYYKKYHTKQFIGGYLMRKLNLGNTLDILVKKESIEGKEVPKLVKKLENKPKLRELMKDPLS